MISPGKAICIAETALTKLKASFSSLLMDVQSSMEGRKVEVKKVRRFMLGPGRNGIFIPVRKPDKHM